MAADEERITGIYKTYIDVICPYVLDYEILTNKFPIPIINEIRAIFTHLAKYNLSDNALIKEKNLSKAESHIKRSILDCHKYICMAYEDEYIKFDKRYKNTDLSLIDNGEFLPGLLEARKNAVNLMREARKTDLVIDSDTNTDNSYKKYEEAFVAYSSVYKLIVNSHKKLENLRRKAITKNSISIAIGIIGIMAGIIVSIVF